MLILVSDNFLFENNLDFKHIDKIIETGLTNLEYCRVLGIIGQSEEPIDNRKIMKDFEERHIPSNKYIYAILKEVCPYNKEIHDDPLFVWEDLIKCNEKELKIECWKIINKLSHFNIINKFPEEWEAVFFENHLNLESKQSL